MEAYLSDLAIERLEAAKSVHAASHSEYVSRGYTVSHAELDDGAIYHTIVSEKLWLAGEGDRRRCQSVLCDILGIYLRRAGFCPHSGKVLVCGLGNRAITSDALGSMVCDRLLVSGRDAVYRSVGFAELYAVCPGVPMQSGIPTGEQVRLLAEHLGADVILTVDAIAARTTQRLSTVIQVSDCGVRAGSGAGRRGDEISSRTMPCRVISIGVPTVIRSSLLIEDALRAHGLTLPASEESSNSTTELEPFLVSNSEIDVICTTYASVISGAINRTFTAELP